MGGVKCALGWGINNAIRLKRAQKPQAEGQIEEVSGSLSTISIKAADDPGATVAVGPGLKVVAHTEPAERRLFMPQAIL